MAPLEPWEKVLVDAEAFLATIHGYLDCQDCHQGDQSPDKDLAHTDLVTYPSDDPETYCGECHPNLTAAADNSLHATLDGYWTVLKPEVSRKIIPNPRRCLAIIVESCHASCGDCHVSRPTSVAGGFIDGHVFQRRTIDDQ